MVDDKKYSSYFSSRGVNPDMYDNVVLPNWLSQELKTDKNASILELGCGYGQNLRAFMKAGYKNIKGIDISDEAVSFCREKGLPVIHKDVLDYDGERFDLVYMSHVLEHLDKNQIIPMLKHIRENLLSPRGGRLCIAVPNAQSNTDCYWMYEDFTHNTLFTAGSLLYVLREAGYTDIRFIDADGLCSSKGIKKIIRKLLLKFYCKNKKFWNKVTGSAYHAPSPVIFTWEIKCIAE